MLACVVEHREEQLGKKKNDAPGCSSWADTEKLVKSSLCSKDSLENHWIKKESKEKEEDEKRCGLSGRAPKQTSL
jgi:hypothetical protein